MVLPERFFAEPLIGGYPRNKAIGCDDDAEPAFGRVLENPAALRIGGGTGFGSLAVATFLLWFDQLEGHLACQRAMRLGIEDLTLKNDTVGVLNP